MKHIEISMTKAKLVLTEAEVLRLVRQDTDTYITALKRGKAFKRADTQRKREQEKFEQEGTL